MDEFDAVLNLEESFVESGRQEGVAKGRLLGVEEGRQLGRIRGFEVGSEIHFYQGVCSVLNKYREVRREAFTERMSKALDNLTTRTNKYPHTNVMDEDLVRQIDQIRAAFKILTSNMHIPLIFNPNDLKASKESSF